MANNRYIIKCPKCGEEQYMGKSLGDGIYNTRGGYFDEKAAIKGGNELLNECYDFMWYHMTNCHKDEFKEGKLFDIVSEYPSKWSWKSIKWRIQGKWHYYIGRHFK